MNWLIASAISWAIIFAGVAIPLYILLKGIGITGLKHVTRYESYTTAYYKMNPVTKLMIVIAASIIAGAGIWPLAAAMSIFLLLSMLTLKDGPKKFKLGFYIFLITFTAGTWTNSSVPPFFFRRMGITHIIVLWAWPRFFWSLGFRAPITVQGLVYGMETSMLYLPTLFAGLILMMTTTPSGLLRALRKVGMPDELNFVIVIALRIIPRLFDSFEVTVNSQFTRGLGSKGSDVLWPLYLAYAAVMATIPVMIYMFKGARNTAIAADTRAFRANPHRTYLKPITFTRLDAITLAVTFGVIAFTIAFSVTHGINLFLKYLG